MIHARDVSSSWKSIPRPRVFGGEIIADRLFLRSALIRKDMLPLYARMPLTYALRTGEDAARADRREAPLNADGIDFDQGWCLKPADSSNAFGISFCKDGALEACFAAARADDERTLWVAQRNIPSLPLLGQHKFHLRLLVLVVGDLDCFLFDDARVLVSPVPMTDDTDHARITNRSFNEAHASYDAATHNQSLRAYEALPGPALLKQARGLISDVAKRLSKADALRRGVDGVPPPPVTGKRHFFALPNAWELFGVDAMVTPAGTLTLLEFNPEPSMGMWGQSKSDILRGKCPVGDGVPRSDDARVGFTKVYSKRFEAALAAARAERSARAAPPAPGPAPAPSALASGFAALREKSGVPAPGPPLPPAA